MDFNWMKLRYQLVKKSSIDPLLIRDRIVCELEKEDYQIQVAKDNVIKFKNDGWGMPANQANKVTEGVFEVLVSESDSNCLIIFTYYISIHYNVFIFCIFFLYGILFKLVALVVAMVVVLATLINIPSIKARSTKLLDDIS